MALPLDRCPRTGAVTLARGRAPTPVLGTVHYAEAAVTCCAGTELRAAAVTREAASEDVGADEAADATCAGDDGGAEIASPGDEGTGDGIARRGGNFVHSTRHRSSRARCSTPCASPWSAAA